MNHFCLVASLALALGLSLVGCSGRTAVPTYINIPAQAGDVAFGDPNARDVRDIVVLAVQKGLEADPINGPYELILPEGTKPDTYARVTYRLGPDALVPGNVPAVPLDDNGVPIRTRDERGKELPLPAATTPMLLGEFPAVEIRAIRVRSAEGSVDLVRPSATGRQLQEVSLGWEAGFGWFAKSVRPWRINPDLQPPPLGPGSRPADPDQPAAPPATDAAS